MFFNIFYLLNVVIVNNNVLVFFVVINIKILKPTVGEKPISAYECKQIQIRMYLKLTNYSCLIHLI